MHLFIPSLKAVKYPRLSSNILGAGYNMTTKRYVITAVTELAEQNSFTYKAAEL